MVFSEFKVLNYLFSAWPVYFIKILDQQNYMYVSTTLYTYMYIYLYYMYST